MSANNNDTDYVVEFDNIDLNTYGLSNEAEYLSGKSYRVAMVNKSVEDDVLQVVLPQFSVESLDIIPGGANAFLRLNLDKDDPKHFEFIQWTKKIDEWIQTLVAQGHKQWFGHMWEQDGPFKNRPYPSEGIIKNMLRETISEDLLFTPRVHVGRKGNIQIQFMDSAANNMDITEFKNCDIVPLIEINGIFFKNNSYNIDWVVRGMVKVSPEIEDVTNIEYKLFHVNDDDEEDGDYYDYATEDETASQVSEVEELEDPSIFQNNENDEQIKELMMKAQQAKEDAQRAEIAYNNYISSLPH
tara:strand:- start:4956 stop:5852 length:897 start_codon:yes stop_codon:yes gene_type:complete